MDRKRIEVSKVNDRGVIIQILAFNGYCTRIVTEKKDGKKVTFIEYWEEK